MATKADSGAAVKISCPACGSEIASDGAKLFAKSKTLSELEETAQAAAQLGPEVEKLEKELTSLREENKQLKAAAVKPPPKKERTADDELLER